MPAADLQPYIAQLRAISFVEDVEKAIAKPDTKIALQLKGGESAHFQVELHTSNLPANAVASLGARATESSMPWLIAAPYIGAPLGEALAKAGVQFIDRQGNCHINIADRFIVRVQGKSPPRRPPAGRPMRAAGYKVLYALLSDPGLVGASQRDVAAAAGTSKQPVADMFERLREEQVLRRTGRQHTWTTPQEGPTPELLARWVEGYRANLRAKLLVGRYRLPVQGPRAIEAWLEEHLLRTDQAFAYGGTAGANRLARHYRGPHTLIHIDGEEDERIRRKIKAMPSPNGELIWMRNLPSPASAPWPKLTANPLLVYAELLRDSDPRAREAAQQVRQKWLPWSL